MPSEVIAQIAIPSSSSEGMLDSTVPAFSVNPDSDNTGLDAKAKPDEVSANSSNTRHSGVHAVFTTVEIHAGVGCCGAVKVEAKHVGVVEDQTCQIQNDTVICTRQTNQ